MYHIIVSLKLNRVFFGQFYWLKVTNLFNKKPTCFKVGFFRFLRSVKFFNYMKNNNILKCVSYKLYYVKWKHNFFFKTQIIEDRDKYRLIKK